jgi:hypothetical protein
VLVWDFFFLESKGKGAMCTVKINRPRPVNVQLVDDILQLGVGGVLSEGAHHLAEFRGGDVACKC